MKKRSNLKKLINEVNSFSEEFVATPAVVPTPVDTLIGRKLASPYSHYLYNPELYKKLIDATAKRLVEIHEQTPFDAVVVRGASGMGMSYTLQYLTGIKTVMVRKKGSYSHGDMVEGFGEIKKYLIMDDFIASGSTIRDIIHFIGKDCQCVGIMLYGSSATAYGQTAFGDDKIKVYHTLPDDIFDKPVY